MKHGATIGIESDANIFTTLDVSEHSKMNGVPYEFSSFGGSGLTVFSSEN